jgi:hypothetical protein
MCINVVGFTGTAGVACQWATDRMLVAMVGAAGTIL